MYAYIYRPYYIWMTIDFIVSKYSTRDLASYAFDVLHRVMYI